MPTMSPTASRTDRESVAPSRPTRDAPDREVTRRPVWIGPCLVATALTAVVGFTGVRGADYPAHEFRAEFWRRAAGATWNFAWYGGHALAPYGVLSPPVVAVLGTFLTVGLATVAATWAFCALVEASLSRRSTLVAGYAFAFAATTDVIVGRVAFGLGLAIGLATLVAWQRGAVGWTLVGALATSLASPVAGFCLALGAAAVAAGTPPSDPDARRRRWSAAAGVIVAAVLPVALTSLAFGGDGRFPYRAGHLAMTLVVVALAARCVRLREVRIGCAFAAAAALALFVVPNPMGGNIVRLPQIIGVPLLIACAASSREAARPRRVALWVGVVAAAAWSASPAIVAATTWHGDPSVEREYFTSLLNEVEERNRDGDVGRLEIPFTVNHWEAAWVATEVPYARGWERQLDIARNPDLYDVDLDVHRYREWLDRNAIRWIALPEAPLDHAGRAEARVVLEAHARGDTWLRRVWQDAQWSLYEVVDHQPIVGEGAVLVRADVDELVVRVDRPGDIEVRVVHSSALAVWPQGCIAPRADGTVRLSVPRPGTYWISSALWDARRSHSAGCREQ